MLYAILALRVLQPLKYSHIFSIHVWLPLYFDSLFKNAGKSTCLRIQHVLLAGTLVFVSGLGTTDDFLDSVDKLHVFLKDLMLSLSFDVFSFAAVASVLRLSIFVEIFLNCRFGIQYFLVMIELSHFDKFVIVRILWLVKLCSLHFCKSCDLFINKMFYFY